MPKRLLFVKREDPEWEAMWQHFPDRTMVNEEYQECLQYIGTVEFPPGEWTHEFRHRAVPGTNKRQYWSFPATEGWQPT